MQPTYLGSWTSDVVNQDLGVGRERRPVYILPESVGEAAVRDEAIGREEAERIGRKVFQYRLRKDRSGEGMVSSPYLFLLGPGSAERNGEVQVAPWLQPISLGKNQFLGIGKDVVDPQFWMGDEAYLPELLDTLYHEVGLERAEELFNNVVEDDERSFSDLYQATAAEAALIHVDERGLDEVPYEIEQPDDLLYKDIERYFVGEEYGSPDGVDSTEPSRLIDEDDERIRMAPRYIGGHLDIYPEDVASIESVEG